MLEAAVNINLEVIVFQTVDHVVPVIDLRMEEREVSAALVVLSYLPLYTALLRPLVVLHGETTTKEDRGPLPPAPRNEWERLCHNV